jgi:hypothetical protein
MSYEKRDLAIKIPGDIAVSQFIFIYAETYNICMLMTKVLISNSNKNKKRLGLVAQW